MFDEGSMAICAHYSSRFGDTTLTKVFVGGLAWETPNEELRRHFEQYGEILEAVVITDKATGKSKGYGFVTFQDPESARLACVESNPIIDGRRANCNIASQGHSLASRAGKVHGHGSNNQEAQQYQRIQPPPAPTPMYYPYGYMTYMGDRGYQQQMQENYNSSSSSTNPRLRSQFQHNIYGSTSTSRMALPYPYVPNWYAMQGPPPPPPPPLPPSFIQYPAGLSSTYYQQVFQVQHPRTY